MQSTTLDETIYKIDTSGKVRFLRVYNQGAELIQESGVMGGAVVPHKRTCSPKNVGRSNETTAEQQAIKEGQSIITNKLKGNYTKDPSGKSNVVLPMLAKSYDKESKKVDWDNAYVQIVGSP